MRKATHTLARTQRNFFRSSLIEKESCEMCVHKQWFPCNRRTTKRINPHDSKKLVMSRLRSNSKYTLYAQHIQQYLTVRLITWYFMISCCWLLLRFFLKPIHFNFHIFYAIITRNIENKFSYCCGRCLSYSFRSVDGRLICGFNVELFFSSLLVSGIIF